MSKKTKGKVSAAKKSSVAKDKPTIKGASKWWSGESSYPSQSILFGKFSFLF